MTHTKGPWSFDFHGINQAGTGLRIAKLSQPAYDHSSGMPERIESFDADGYLMAAAPEMFEALEELVNHLSDMEDGKWLNNRAGEQAIKTLQKARGQ